MWIIPSDWKAKDYTITALFDGTGINYTNSTDTGNLAVFPVMKAYWMRYDDVSYNPRALRDQGITDIFFLTRGINGAYHYDKLQWAINTYKPYGIKVHAWIVCFKDDNQFKNPSGYYSYNRKIYVTTTKRWGTKVISYKVKKRVKWKKVGKRWKYRYKYITKYKYRKGWIYTPIYRTETRNGTDTSYNDRLINYISDISNNYNVDGIHLDYVRYSGVEKYGNAAWQQPGGAEAAVNTITSFVQQVKNNIKPTIKLSAAVMPEGATNGYTYGQDYEQLAKYVDYLVPMIYKGNYNKTTAWIGETTSKIKALSGNKTIVAGLQTYYSDSNPHGIPRDELQNDINTAIGSGASGFVLFRYEAHTTHTSDISLY